MRQSKRTGCDCGLLKRGRFALLAACLAGWTAVAAAQSQEPSPSVTLLRLSGSVSDRATALLVCEVTVGEFGPERMCEKGFIITRDADTGARNVVTPQAAITSFYYLPRILAVRSL